MSRYKKRSRTNEISPPQSPVPPRCRRHPHPLHIADIFVIVLIFQSHADETGTTKLILETK